jgi:hypothetical protein
MTQSIEILSTEYKTWRVMPRWRGKNLAVHAPVVGGKCVRKEREWVITHLQSGYSTGGSFYGTLREAIKAAKFWDTYFETATVENANRWPLREQWKRIIQSGRAERPWRSLKTVQEILARN